MVRHFELFLTYYLRARVFTCLIQMCMLKPTNKALGAGLETWISISSKEPQLPQTGMIVVHRQTTEPLLTNCMTVWSASCTAAGCCDL